MAYIITEENDLYQIESTISGELMFDKMVTEDEVKEVFIGEKVIELIENVIKIDMEFPHNYKINGVNNNKNRIFISWSLEKMNSENYYDELKNKLIEISERNETLKPTCDILVKFFD